MTTVNVYLPDALAEDAQRAGLDVSVVAQEALKKELSCRAHTPWIESVTRLSALGVTDLEIIAELDGGEGPAVG